MNPLLASLAGVWDKTDYCRINRRQLRIVARKFAHFDFVVPNWREPIFPELDDDLFIEFLGITNAINFCFASPETGRKFDVEYPKGSGIIYYGSSAMTACVKQALDNGIPILSPEYLENVSKKEVEEIFSHHANPMPMIAKRVEHLNNIGATLLGIHEPTSFAKIFEDADYLLFNNSDGIVEKIIKNFTSYRDRGKWKGFKLLFYKRAQLLPMIYHGRALDSKGKLQLIRDTENFGVITDCAVPNAFRILGILNYKKTLAKIIDSGTRITADSQLEIEIRIISAKNNAGFTRSNKLLQAQTWKAKNYNGRT